jgi:hypothetical protein
MNMIKIKRALTVLALGGSTFFFWGGGNGWTGGCFDMLRNSDVINFTQAIGDQSIQAFSDGVLDDNVANSDYDLIIRGPATTAMQAWWDNYVLSRYPIDP